MNSTIWVSLLVLLGSLGLGLGTGYFTFTLGSESLKGVKSPADNPSQKITDKQLDLSKKQEFKLIEEKTILVNVYDDIHGQREISKKKKDITDLNKKK